MRVLLIGDVVARPGRVAVMERIQDLREQYRIDLSVLNAENVAGGFSITPPLAEQLFAAGIDVMTSGNHIFDKREVVEYIQRQPRLLRPANYPPNTPGKGLWLGEVVATFGLLLVVFGVVRSGRTSAAPFAVGAYITGAYFFTSSTSDLALAGSYAGASKSCPVARLT